jgi:hypothetical protein
LAKPQVKFQLVSLQHIPGRMRAAPFIPERPGKSTWDDALAALKKRGAIEGIRVRAPSADARQKMKCSLLTIAKSRAMTVEVRNDDRSNDFFAWLSNRPGRLRLEVVGNSG